MQRGRCDDRGETREASKLNYYDATSMRQYVALTGVSGSDLPYCPIEEDPPRTRADLPVYLPRPPSAQGGVSLTDCVDGSSLYKTRAAVGRAMGMLAAASNDMLVGIWRASLELRGPYEGRDLP